MAVGRRPDRYNPEALRLTFVPEIERCLKCDLPLSSEGSTAHSAKTVQTFHGAVYVVAYSRVCVTPGCACQGHHYHASGHLKLSLPYSTYGLDVVAHVGLQRDRQHRQFLEITAGLNALGVAINDHSVGRLYRQFLALLSGTWPQRAARLQAAVRQYGGLTLLSDGLAPDGDGPQLYVLWEALSATPISGLVLDKADSAHVTKWLGECRHLLEDLPVRATMCDGQEALQTGLQTNFPDAYPGLCQSHFLSNLAEPVEAEDRLLKQTLQTQLSRLPGVPVLTLEQAEERAKPFQVMAEGVAFPDLEPAVPPTAPSSSRFAHLLFPSSSSSTDAEIAGPSSSLRVVQLERYYGYYRRAIRDALTQPSRAPLQYGGLEGYDQLVGIHQALQLRQAQCGTDLYLDGLQDRVQTAITAIHTQAEALRQAKDGLVRVERCLSQTPLPSLETLPDPTPAAPPRSEIVAQALKQIFEDLAEQPDLSLTTRGLIDKWQRMQKNWMPGILQCYDVPGLPRHNLSLEGIFGTLRRAERRVSGRKETSSLRVFGPGELILASLGDDQVLPWLQSVPGETYWAERRKQEEREEPRRWLRRLRQNPVQALAQVDQQFRTVVNEPAGASP
jgi:hypothetical protein